MTFILLKRLLFLFFLSPFLILVFYSLKKLEKVGTSEYIKKRGVFLGSIFMFLLLLFMLSEDIKELIQVKDKYNHKEYSVVEGIISDYKDKRVNSNRYISFKVDGIKFFYQKKILSACFSGTKSNQKKVIQNGQKVKIYFIDSCIVELWSVYENR